MSFPYTQPRPMSGPVSTEHRRATELAAQAWSVLESDQTPKSRREAISLLSQAIEALKGIGDKHRSSRT